MSTFKSFSVGNGDMFYISHNNGSFTIVDCSLTEENYKRIMAEIRPLHARASITRFISTHPDEDHLLGLKYLDQQLPIRNFYCVANEATKEDPSLDFEHCCQLRDSGKAFHLRSGCRRQWLNETGDGRNSSGIHVLWPVVENEHFQATLALARGGESPNNISPIVTYSVGGGGTAMWMGDLETDFMERIADKVAWPRVDVLFAPHHGRDTGKVPEAILKKINPKIIVVGEAPAEHLNYYPGYSTITQNTAGDITFEFRTGAIDAFVSEPEYRVDFLEDQGIGGPDFYLGTLRVS